MGAATGKDGLLARLAEERAGWEALLSEVGEERMARPGAMGEWTFKDAVAHLAAWRWETVGRLEAAARGDDPPPPQEGPGIDTDEVNARWQERDRAKPLDQVLRESRESWDRMEAAVRALPEDALMEPGRYPWMGGEALGPGNLEGSFDHFHGEHEAELRAWLARQDGGGR